MLPASVSIRLLHDSSLADHREARRRARRRVQRPVRSAWARPDRGDPGERGRGGGRPRHGGGDGRAGRSGGGRRRGGPAGVVGDREGPGRNRDAARDHRSVAAPARPRPGPAGPVPPPARGAERSATAGLPPCAAGPSPGIGRPAGTRRVQPAGGTVAHRDLIVVGTSAGGIQALQSIARGLSPDLPASVLVVLHLPPESPGLLPAILNRAGRLPASHATDGEPLRAGRIYVAPANAHMLVEDGHLRLARGPRENLHRPAVDPLFRSAAVAYGPRVVGVVLTGALDDGTAGLSAIQRTGGTTVVQDPADALYPSMPQSAMRNTRVD